MWIWPQLQKADFFCHPLQLLVNRWKKLHWFEIESTSNPAVPTLFKYFGHRQTCSATEKTAIICDLCKPWIQDMFYFYLSTKTSTTDIKWFLSSVLLTQKRCIFPLAAECIWTGSGTMIGYMHRACWVYLRCLGKSVFFPIPLASVRQRWWGSRAVMLDVSGRGERGERSGREIGSREELTEQLIKGWQSREEMSGVMVPLCWWIHEITAVQCFPLNLTQTSHSHIIRTPVRVTFLDYKEQGVLRPDPFQQSTACKSHMLIC